MGWSQEELEGGMEMNMIKIQCTHIWNSKKTLVKIFLKKKILNISQKRTHTTHTHTGNRTPYSYSCGGWKSEVKGSKVCLLQILGEFILALS